MAKLNDLKTGEKILVKTSIENRWLMAEVQEDSSLRDKFVLLENGEELFSFEIEKYKKLS